MMTSEVVYDVEVEHKEETTDNGKKKFKLLVYFSIKFIFKLIQS